MRVVIVGAPAERARLRDSLTGYDIDVAGEAPTLAAARAAGLDADAFLVATSPVDSSPPPGRDADDTDSTEPLTPRELDVLRQLALGLSNRGIADRLGISDQTVKFHVASIIAKLGAANRTEVVRRAVRRGLIDL